MTRTEHVTETMTATETMNATEAASPSPSPILSMTPAPDPVRLPFGLRWVGRIVERVADRIVERVAPGIAANACQEIAEDVVREATPDAVTDAAESRAEDEVEQAAEDAVGKIDAETAVADSAEKAVAEVDALECVSDAADRVIAGIDVTGTIRDVVAAIMGDEVEPTPKSAATGDAFDPTCCVVCGVDPATLDTAPGSLAWTGTDPADEGKIGPVLVVCGGCADDSDRCDEALSDAARILWRDPDADFEVPATLPRWTPSDAVTLGLILFAILRHDEHVTETGDEDVSDFLVDLDAVGLIDLDRLTTVDAASAIVLDRLPGIDDLTQSSPVEAGRACLRRLDVIRELTRKRRES